MKEPNILMITTDQQRYDSLGFTSGNKIKTPNLDSLREKGISFENAFTPCPTCCPARQTMISGVMPSKHGGHWNYDMCPTIPALKPSDYPGWTSLVKDNGYNTAYVGKWHVSPEHDPCSFGYDKYIENPEWNKDDWKRKHQMEFDNDTKVSPGRSYFVGMYDIRPLQKCSTHIKARETINIMEEYSQKNEPWHIRIDFSEPHLPCIPAEPFASMYDPKKIEEWGNFRESFENKPFIQKQQLLNWGIEDWTWEHWSIYLSGYFGIISQLDHAVGMILNKMDEHDLYRDTIVVYSTDHGDAAGSHRMIDKHYVMYEEEVHVPLVIRWDSHVEANSSSKDFVSNYLDMGPTVLDILGIEIPEYYQGKSFKKQLQGIDNPEKREIAFSEYNGQQFGLYTQRMVRDDKYKYIWNASDTDEFYDLKNDPWEMNNLANKKEHNDLLSAYKKKLVNTFTDLEDPMILSMWNRFSLTGELDRRIHGKEN